MVNSLKYTQLKLFADGTNKFFLLKTLYSNANEDLKSLSNWFIAIKLSLSGGSGKDCRYSLFSPTKLELNSNLPKLYVGDGETR